MGSEKLKIAVISPHYGYIKRGNEAGTRDINRYLRNRGHIVDTFSLGNGDDIIHIESIRKDKGIGKLSRFFVDSLPIHGFSTKYLGYSLGIEDLAFSLKAQKTILEYINKNNYDLIWSNGEIWEAILSSKLRKITGTPTLVFFGGGISAMMIREARTLPDIFAVMVPSMEKFVRKNVPRCNVFTTVGGIDLDFFNPNVKMMDNDFERPIVLSSSIFIETKRLDLIVKAMSEIKEGTLVMTSDGPLREKICKMGTKLLGKRFKYLGRIPDDQMPGLYKMADVLVSTSRNEPYGRILLECMGTNTPVIAENDETRRWVVGDAGILVDDCRDINQLSRAITKSIVIDWKDKPRKQAEKFNWEKTVDDYEEQIRKILC